MEWRVGQGNEFDGAEEHSRKRDGHSLVTPALIWGSAGEFHKRPLHGGSYFATAMAEGMSAAPNFSMSFRFPFVPAVCIAVTLLTSAVSTHAEDAEPRRELEALRKSNAALEELVRQQASVIAGLNRRVTAIEQTGTKGTEGDEAADGATPATTSSGLKLGRINLSGEVGVAFFHSGSEGAFPNAEFRVDEAKLFVEAPVWGNVYFFTELNLAQRESRDLALRVGEFYLDVENLFGLEQRARLLNLRVGRLDVPFGEEYQTRDVIDNSLVSHSLADFWGVDEGVEVYGSLGKFSYVLAVQNGGVPVAQDFTKDKAIIGRLAFDPNRWLHVSVSGMRTGDLDVDNDYLSELWYGGGWFRSIGGPGTTRFHANLVEGDVAVRWTKGYLKAFGGAIRYDDNDPLKANARSMFFYSVEGRQQLNRKLYAAARFSQIFADKGYPLTGHGNMDEFFFNYSPSALTTELWRLGLGLGYRFNDRFLLKTEYTFEGGRMLGGGARDHEDLFAAEAAFKF